MPKVSGFESCRKFKEAPRTAAIPVIFLTAVNEGEDKVRGLELGAVDYITKPLNLMGHWDPIKGHWVRKHRSGPSLLVAKDNTFEFPSKQNALGKHFILSFWGSIGANRQIIVAVVLQHHHQVAIQARNTAAYDLM